MLIYIASPYTIGNKLENVKRQIQVADVLLEHGYNPVLPLLNHFWHEISPKTEDQWLAYDLSLLDKCAYLLRLPGESIGSDIEVEYAENNMITVFYDLVELLDELDVNN